VGGSFTYNRDDIQVEDNKTQQKLYGSRLKATFSNQIREKLELKFGGDYFYQSYTVDQSFDFNDSIIHGSINDHRTAVFTEVEHYVSKKLVFNAGLRLEHGSFTQQTLLSPRLSMAYRFKDESQLSMAYGWFAQDPSNQIKMMYPKAQTERAVHYIVNYQKELGKRKIYSEIYYKNYTDLVKFNPSEPNLGNGYAYGLDFHFRDKKSIKNGDYWISYSFLQTECDFLHYPNMARPSFSSTHQFSMVYKHWFTALRSYVGMTMRYNSPRAHNNPNQNEFMSDHLPVFKRIDMNWSYLYRNNIIFYASISNVPGFENINGYSYSPITNGQGVHERAAQLSYAKRFYFIGCFITLSKKGSENQLDMIN